MKNLNLEQMEKVNGGDPCARYKRRWERYTRKGNKEAATRMYEKAVAYPCDYSN
ncbi:hypothetical protein [Marinifilum fragile]|uniref:hypothetical protein n=1 Tax=Marinifilum fragile TaxID=570161 RepID=UPI002AA63B11|nr:hypothetical protein [Marinifilum fragile]